MVPAVLWDVRKAKGHKEVTTGLMEKKDKLLLYERTVCAHSLLQVLLIWLLWASAVLAVGRTVGIGNDRAVLPLPVLPAGPLGSASDFTHLESS